MYTGMTVVFYGTTGTTFLGCFYADFISDFFAHQLYADSIIY